MWERHGLTFRPVERGDLDLLRAHRNESAGAFRDPMHAWPGDQEAWFRSLSRERQAFVVIDDYACTRVDPGLRVDPGREREWVPDANDPSGRGGHWGEYKPASVPTVGLLRFSDFDWINRSVGYTGCDVFAHARGRGYATRISLAAAEYAFEEWGMHRVWGEALATNEPMLRALRRAGFVDEACFRQAIWRGGEWVDFLRLSRIEGEPVRAVEPEPLGADGPGPYHEPGRPPPDGPMPEGL